MKNLNYPIGSIFTSDVLFDILNMIKVGDWTMIDVVAYISSENLESENLISLLEGIKKVFYEKGFQHGINN